MRVRTSLLAVALLAAAPAFGEASAVNIHLDPGLGTGLDRGVLVSGASLKIDTTLVKALGPVAPQVEFFGLGAVTRSYLLDGSAFGAGLGLRLRLFNDEQGYYFAPGTRHHGNLWGNLWVDAHVTFSGVQLGVGFDAAVGYEFSLVEGLSVGPFAKFYFWGGDLSASGGPTAHSTLQFGLSFTVGAPVATPPDADYDLDGVKGDDDKCPDDAGPKENDGCPIGDEDKDGVPDKADACPKVAGPKENKGCPWGDTDQDGLTDDVDQCPKEAGPKENGGCPDTDKDGDTVPDRLDKCPDEKGDPRNNGCPWPDTDKDGVVDPYDNCPTEPGPPENQGCPVKVKQLVVITPEKLVIKDKVYFDTDKATIQPKSFGMLDQIVAILGKHPEITLVQIEGHTDTVGDAGHNRVLSQQRADSVKAYLVKKGVADPRLKAVGFGPDKPADTNETPAGRENNRRVEFNILQQ